MPLMSEVNATGVPNRNDGRREIDSRPFAWIRGLPVFELFASSRLIGLRIEDRFALAS
jgi:hypothetical protein